MIPWVVRNPSGGWGFRGAVNAITGNYKTMGEAFMTLAGRMAKSFARDQRLAEQLTKSGKQPEGDNYPSVTPPTPDSGEAVWPSDSQTRINVP